MYKVEHGHAHAYYSGAMEGRDKRIPGLTVAYFLIQGETLSQENKVQSDRTCFPTPLSPPPLTPCADTVS